MAYKLMARLLWWAADTSANLGQALYERAMKLDPEGAFIGATEERLFGPVCPYCGKSRVFDDDTGEDEHAWRQWQCDGCGAWVDRVAALATKVEATLDLEGRPPSPWKGGAT